MAKAKTKSATSNAAFGGKPSKFSAKEQDELLLKLHERFESNPGRHPGITWAKVQVKLEDQLEKLWSLAEMERTGGEPDVVGQDKKTGEFIFVDCAAESPSGRRSLCYDGEALEARKEHKPKGSAMEMATLMGIEMLTEEEYRELQKLGKFDTKTSSWVKTPAETRKLGGAIFCDPAIREGFYISQRSRVVLCGEGVSGVVEGLESPQHALRSTSERATQPE